MSNVTYGWASDGLARISSRYVMGKVVKCTSKYLVVGRLAGLTVLVFFDVFGDVSVRSIGRCTCRECRSYNKTSTTESHSYLGN